jgi:hypothetical protein
MNAMLLLGFEAGRLDGNIVIAGREPDSGIGSVRVGQKLALPLSSLVSDADTGLGYGTFGRVLNESCDGGLLGFLAEECMRCEQENKKTSEPG